MAVIKGDNRSLDSILSAESAAPERPEPPRDPRQRLLRSTTRFVKQNKGHKWISNFEVAAMHLHVNKKVYFIYMFQPN